MNYKAMFLILFGFLLVGCSSTGEAIKVPSQPGISHDQTTGKVMGLSTLHKQNLLQPPPIQKNNLVNI